MKFQNPSMHGSWQTEGRTDGQPETNMPRQLLRSWGHKNIETFQMDPIYEINSQFAHDVLLDIHMLQILTN